MRAHTSDRPALTPEALVIVLSRVSSVRRNIPNCKPDYKHFFAFQANYFHPAMHL